jgi:NADH dehydrogenase FAD-containing subunit
MSTLLVIGGGIEGLSAIAGVRTVEKKLKTTAASKIVLVDPKDFCEIA